MSFYTNFSRICNEKGMSQSKALELMGMDRSAVTRWKNPKNQPTYNTLLKISEFFNVPVAELQDYGTMEITAESLFKPTNLEKKLIYAWREATPKDKRIIEAVLSVYGFSLGDKKEPQEDVG